MNILKRFKIIYLMYLICLTGISFCAQATNSVGFFCTGSSGNVANGVTMSAGDYAYCDSARQDLLKFVNNSQFGNYNFMTNSTSHMTDLNSGTPVPYATLAQYDVLVIVSVYNPIDSVSWSNVIKLAHATDKNRTIVLFTDACSQCSSGAANIKGSGVHVTDKISSLINELNPDTSMKASPTIVNNLLTPLAMNPYSLFKGGFDLITGQKIEYAYFTPFINVPIGNIITFDTTALPPITDTASAASVVLPRAQSISKTCIIATVDANPLANYGNNANTYNNGSTPTTYGNKMLGAFMGAALNATGACNYVPKIDFRKQVIDANGDGYASPNEILTYTITYTNNEPISLSSLSIFDTAPDGTTLVAGSATGPAGFPISQFNDSNGKLALKWGVGILAPGASITVTFQVKVASDITLDTIDNVATDSQGDKSYTLTDPTDPTSAHLPKASIPVLKIDHFQFAFASTGLTCNDQDVTVSACKDSACSMIVPETFNLSLLPNSTKTADGEWVAYAGCDVGDTACQTLAGNRLATSAGTQLDFKNGIATIALRRLDEGVSTIGMDTVASAINAVVTGSPTYSCFPDGSTSAGSCNITFSDAGFLFKGNIPNGISNKPLKTLQFYAMKNDETLDPLTTDKHNRCIPRFVNTTASIGFWHDYVSPATGTMKLRLAALQQSGGFDTDIDVTTSVAVNASNIATTEANAMAAQRPVYFDNTGMATINLRYPDAGQIDLNLEYKGAVGAPDEGLTIKSVTKPFIFRPYGLYISRDASFSSCDMAPTNDASLFSSCGQANVHHAGQPFILNITPKAWVSDSAIANVNVLTAGDLTLAEARQFNGELATNPVTPNFVAMVPLANHLLAPTGGVNGILVPARTLLNGVTAAALSIDEAGVFEINVGAGANTLTGFAYLDPTVVLPATLSMPLGVFVPDYFKTEPTHVTVTDVHSLFTYMGEPGIKVHYEVNAYTKLNSLTHNYGLFPSNWLDSFVIGLADPLQPMPATSGSTNEAHLNRTLAGVTATGSQWDATAAQDVYVGDVSHMTYKRRDAGTQGYTTGNSANYVDGPYNLSPTIKTEPSAPLAIPFKTMGSDSGVIGGVIANPTATTNVRFGLITVPHDVFAPLHSTAKIPFKVDYWDGSKFVVNTDDDDSLIYPSLTGVISQCRTVATTSTLALPTDNKVTSGAGELEINTPTQNEHPIPYWFAMSNSGTLVGTCISGDRATLVSTNQDWLTFNWTENEAITTNNSVLSYLDPHTIVHFTSKTTQADRKIIYRQKY